MPQFYITALMKKYRITCLGCKQSDIVLIDEANHVVGHYEKQAATNFLSMRWRADLQWGMECICGNDNRLAAAEAKEFSNLVQGDSVSVQKIAESLKIPDKKQFSMEAA